MLPQNDFLFSFVKVIIADQHGRKHNQSYGNRKIAEKGLPQRFFFAQIGLDASHGISPIGL